MSTKLKMQLDNLDGLDESLHGFYEEQDGKFVLNLDGYEDPAALKRAKDHEKEARKKAEKELKDLRQEFEDLKAELENNSDDKARKKGDVAALEQSYKDKIEKLKTDHQKELEARDSQISKLLVDNVAETMAADLSDAPELLSDIIRKRLKAENGETRVLDANGELSATTVDELREEFRANKKYAAIIRGSQANGGGSGGGGKGGGATKSFKELTEKERVELAKNNPAEFQRLLDAHKAESKTNY
jgi:chromosome segregation ATPase